MANNSSTGIITKPIKASFIETTRMDCTDLRITGYRVPVVTGTASNMTITTAQSGSIITIPSSIGSDVTWTLPKAEIGLCYEFISLDDPGSNSVYLGIDSSDSFRCMDIALDEGAGSDVKITEIIGSSGASLRINFTNASEFTRFKLYCITENKWHGDTIHSHSTTIILATA